MKHKSIFPNINDKEYLKLVKTISSRYKDSQIKASISINTEMLRLYWSIGKEISKVNIDNKYGTSFYEVLSNDIKKMTGVTKGFSARNLRYMKKFYELYNSSILQQVVAKSKNKHIKDSVDELQVNKIFSIPRGHHMAIINRFKPKDIDKALFFIDQTIKNGWSRAVLLNFIDTDLYKRQGKAISNFDYSLPCHRSELVQEITKDPYKFDFLNINDNYNEKQLKDALMDNITKLLLEMGTGFSFVGKEFPLPIKDTEEYIDLLFYHLTLHCYIVVEVKIVPFKSSDIGQIGTYVTIVDDILCTEKEEKTIGLIICKNKNNVLAKYATRSSSKPIAISSYEISKLLPTEKQIEKCLKNK